MGRRKKSLRALKSPKLFPRGANGVLYFRVWSGGKDKWVSTKTADPTMGAKAAEAYISGLDVGDLTTKTERSIHKVAQNVSKVVMERLTGKDVKFTPVESGNERWMALYRKYYSLSEATKASCKTVWSHFSNWCSDNGIAYLEDVSREAALGYSKFLWEKGISPKTYNDHIRHLSRVFSTIDAATPLPCMNPFNKSLVDRIAKSEAQAISHNALEPEMLKSVIDEAAMAGRDMRDLFVIGAQTGLRLKDAALLQWESIDGDFIQLKPFKTRRKQRIVARIPISLGVRRILVERKAEHAKSKYVLDSLAKQYLETPSSVSIQTKRVFERALGKEVTQEKAGSGQRKNAASVYSFHSLRTTYMSLLASQDVSIRDAMRIMGWESVEMIRLYEHELRKAHDNADQRTLKMIGRIDEFAAPIPDARQLEPRIVPSACSLEWLSCRYSNVAIGMIYGISEAAVRKWMAKFGVHRKKRIESPGLSESTIPSIRQELVLIEGISHANACTDSELPR